MNESSDANVWLWFDTELYIYQHGAYIQYAKYVYQYPYRIKNEKMMSCPL